MNTKSLTNAHLHATEAVDDMEITAMAVKISIVVRC